MLESATRGLDRLEAVTQRLDPNTVKGLLDKLQVPPLSKSRTSRPCKTLSSDSKNSPVRPSHT